MEPNTLRLRAELWDTLAEEADEQGYSSRSEYIRHLLRNRTDTASNTPSEPDRHRFEYADRLDELEARINALESRSSDTTRENGSDSPLSASDSDTMETPREGAPEDGSRAVDGDDVRGRVREAFADRSRMDPDTVDAVATAAAFLADRGDRVATKELKEHTYAEFGEHYSSERSMWNSIDRYLEELPFVEKPGYGKWRYSPE